jgi:hypothetical protein
MTCPAPPWRIHHFASSEGSSRLTASLPPPGGGLKTLLCALSQ